MITQKEIQAYSNGMVMAVIQGMQKMHIPVQVRAMLEFIQYETMRRNIQYDYNTAMKAVMLFKWVAISEPYLVEKIKEVFGKYVDLRNYPLSGSLKEENLLQHER